MSFNDDQPTGTLRALRSGQPPPDIAWRPAASPGVQVGLLLLVGLSVLTVLGVWLATAQDGALRLAALMVALLAGGAAGAVGVLLHALLAVRYHVGAQALEIEWLGRRVRIPWESVQDAEWQGETRRGMPAAPRAQQRWEPWWPGYAVRFRRRADSNTQDVTLATLEQGRRVVLLHARGTLVISPERPVRFLAEVALRVALALERGVPAAMAPPPANSRSITDASVTAAADDIPTVASAAASDMPMATTCATASAQPAHASAARSATPPAATLRQTAQTARTGFMRSLLAGFTALGQERTGSLLLSVLGGLPILLGMVLYSRLDVVPEQLPIHWDADGQADRFGSERMLWLLPSAALVAAVLSILLASWVLLRDRVAALALLWCAVLVQLALAIALLRLT